MVAFSDPNDIESMRKHEGYEEVKDEIQETIKKVAVENADETRKEVLTVTLKKRGRPARVSIANGR